MSVGKTGGSASSLGADARSVAVPKADRLFHRAAILAYRGSSSGSCCNSYRRTQCEPSRPQRPPSKRTCANLRSSSAVLTTGAMAGAAPDADACPPPSITAVLTRPVGSRGGERTTPHAGLNGYTREKASSTATARARACTLAQKKKGLFTFRVGARRSASRAFFLPLLLSSAREGNVAVLTAEQREMGAHERGREGTPSHSHERCDHTTDPCQ